MRSAAWHEVPPLISLSGRSQNVISMWCKNDELANIKHTVNHQCELDYLGAFKIVCKEKERKGEKEGGLAATVQHGPRESNSSAAAETATAKPSESQSSMKWSHLEGEMGREMGCREEREVGVDGWVDGGIRGIARQAFRMHILSYAPTRCPWHVHTYEHKCPHLCQHQCSCPCYIWPKKENPKKLPHFSDIPLRGLWLSSIPPLAHLTLDIKKT